MVQPFLPNKADANVDHQAYPDSVDFDILLDGFAYTGVVSGCAVTEDPVTPDMTVDVAAGVVRLLGAQITVGAQAGNVITANASGNPRIDLISVNSGGTVVVTAGTPAAAATVEAPAVPASSVALAFVYVADSESAIDDVDIVDKRVTVPAVVVGVTVVGNAATGSRIDFQNSDVTIYDGDNAKRLEILNGGDIVLYYENGTTEVVRTVTSTGYVELNGVLEFQGSGALVRFGTTPDWNFHAISTEYRIEQGVTNIERLVLRTSGDSIEFLDVAGATVAIYDDTADRWVFSEPVVANKPTRYTTTQTLTQADRLVNCDGSAFTVTLPALSTLSLPTSILIYAGGSGDITVAPNAADNIDGAGTSIVLTGGESPPAALGLCAYNTTDDWETVSTQGTVT